MLAALVLLGAFALVVAWEVLCLAEVVRADQVRLLPRWVWAVACLLMIPFGGIAYLLVGRVWVTARPAARVLDGRTNRSGGNGCG